MLKHPSEMYKKEMMSKGKANSNTNLVNTADRASQGMKTSALIRHHNLLHISMFKSEVQQQLLNFLFDGEHVFGPRLTRC